MLPWERLGMTYREWVPTAANSDLGFLVSLLFFVLLFVASWFVVWLLNRISGGRLIR